MVKALIISMIFIIATTAALMVDVSSNTALCFSFVFGENNL